MGGNNPEFQRPIVGNITAVSQNIDLDSPNRATEIIQVSGTWSGTLVIEGSNDDTTYYPLFAINLSNKLAITSITSNGVFACMTNGFQHLRIRSSAWTSGTADINVYGSDAASLIFADATLRGASDGTPIGNTGDRMNVDANLDPGQLVPTITNKLRVRKNIGDITLASDPAYTTLFSRSGSGLFFGFQTGFNGSTVKIKLTIDGGEVFDLLLDDVRDFQFNDTTTTRCQAGAFLTTIGNVLDFSSRFAIPYNTSISLEATSVSGGKKNTNWLVILTEDT